MGQLTSVETAIVERCWITAVTSRARVAFIRHDRRRLLMRQAYARDEARPVNLRAVPRDLHTDAMEELSRPQLATTVTPTRDPVD
jgi:hypothetical protein